MKALTLWPEWAFAVTDLGKNVENRTWIPTLKPGESFFIHAGKHFGGKVLRKSTDWLQVFQPVLSTARHDNWITGYSYTEHSILGTRLTSMTQIYKERLPLYPVEEIPTGAIVAIASFTKVLIPGVHSPIGFPWWDGLSNGIEFGNLLVLKTPVACRGYQRLWTPPKETQERVLQLCIPSMESEATIREA